MTLRTRSRDQSVNFSAVSSLYIAPICCALIPMPGTAALPTPSPTTLLFTMRNEQLNPAASYLDISLTGNYARLQN